jgi:monoamine oxidase
MFDAIVVGAGFAGVTAARELGWHGMRVLILEGRERIGGRTFRTVVDTQPLELGGAYVHWLQPHVWAEINRYNLAVVTRPDNEIERVLVVSQGQLHTLSPETAFAMLAEAYEAFYTAAPNAFAIFPEPFNPLGHKGWKEYDHLSLADQLRQVQLSPLSRDLLSALLATDGSSALANVALNEALRLRALSGTHNGAKLAEINGTYFLRDGTISLLDAMLSDTDAELKTSAPVHRIVQRHDEVRVTAQDGATYTARVVVVTAPLNTLSRITFDPTLTLVKRRVSEERHAGCGVKLFVKVRGRMSGFIALAPDTAPLSMLMTYADDGGDTWLLGFGPDAERLDLSNRESVQEAVHLFIPHVDIISIAGHDWNRDIFSLGSWCNLRPEQARNYLVELGRPEGRVFFAGADIAFGWRGYIDGAIESGVRAARQALQVLKA